MVRRQKQGSTIKVKQDRVVLQEQYPKNARRKETNGQGRKERNGLGSLILSCLGKHRKSTKMPIRKTTETTTYSGSETPSQDATSFEPNWDDFMPSTAVDLDEWSFPLQEHELEVEEEDTNNRVSPSWTGKATSSNPQESSKQCYIHHPNDQDERDDDDDAKDASLQLPLCRRILVDLASAVDALQGPQPILAAPEKPRSRGNASLGEAQPSQPTRRRQEHFHRHYSPSCLVNKTTTHDDDNGTWWTDGNGNDDDVSSCSGITMDSIDSTMFHHGESIISSLFAQPGNRISSFQAYT